jgi:Ca-activated chloride channel family protein
MPLERRADNAPAQVQMAAVKRVQPVVTPAPGTVTLPRTATDADLKMIVGVILLTFSLILLVFNRRQFNRRQMLLR